MVHKVIAAARTLRHRYLPVDARVVSHARAAAQWTLQRIPGWATRGAPVALGDAGVIRVAPELLVGSLDFSTWGAGRNAGFRTWVAACAGKRVILDIGAHIGLYAIPASRVLVPDGICYAFEPAAPNVAVLRRHLAYNGCGNVEVHTALVGDRDADAVPFFEQSAVVGMNSVVVTKHAERYVRTVHSQVTIDTFCAARGIAPDVVKIDVEGGEFAVFIGAERTFRRYHPTIVLSVHPDQLAALGASTDALAAVIRGLGYTARDAAGHPVHTFVADDYVLSV